jgi:hypothetical protein
MFDFTGHYNERHSAPMDVGVVFLRILATRKPSLAVEDRQKTIYLLNKSGDSLKTAALCLLRF